jgi:hypothetical protein
MKSSGVFTWPGGVLGLNAGLHSGTIVTVENESCFGCFGVGPGQLIGFRNRYVAKESYFLSQMIICGAKIGQAKHAIQILEAAEVNPWHFYHLRGILWGLEIPSQGQRTPYLQTIFSQ